MHTRKDCWLLYVDDEASNRLVFESTFGEDLPILCAASGEEALELLDRHEVGVLLTDQRMPGMSGIDLCERVREAHPHCIRILVTAWSDKETAIDAINRGGLHRFLTKPWDSDDLSQILTDSLARYRLERAVATLRNTVAEREQLIAMSVLRARVLHDLANVTTALMLTTDGLRHDLDAASDHLPVDLGRTLQSGVTELESALRYLVKLHDKTRSIISRPHPAGHAALDLIHAAMEIVKDDVRRTLHVHVEGPAEAMVWADKTDITRILVNLVLNARRAIEAQGRSDGQVRIRVSLDDDRVQILVSDDGPGIPEPLRPALWDPERASRPLGTGLGLPISRQLAYANQGDITLEPSGPLPGATFRLVLAADQRLENRG